MLGEEAIILFFSKICKTCNREHFYPRKPFTYAPSNQRLPNQNEQKTMVQMIQNMRVIMNTFSETQNRLEARIAAREAN